MNALSRTNAPYQVGRALTEIERAFAHSLHVASTALADGTVAETIRSVARLANDAADCSDAFGGGALGMKIRSVARLANDAADCLDKLTARSTGADHPGPD